MTTSWCLDVTAAAYVTQDKDLLVILCHRRSAYGPGCTIDLYTLDQWLSTGFALGHRFYSGQRMTTQQRISLVHKTKFNVFIV